MRIDAFSIQYNWYGTNLPGSQELPEWVKLIGERVTLPEGESAVDVERDTMSQILEKNAHDTRNRYRACLWGLAQAPGGLPGIGGITAVLVTEHLINGSRGGRTRGGSHILFGVQKRRPSEASSIMDFGDRSLNEYDRPATTTEAAMWMYMYGGGPEVVPRATAVGRQGQGQSAGPHEGIVANQICSICAAPINERYEISTCANGHSFDRCTGTGLAIQKPNVSRVCGVCGRKTLLPSALEEIWTLSGTTITNWEALYVRLLDKVCGFCGGKFFGQ